MSVPFHGNVAIGLRDRKRLERLLRYPARSAVALERLSWLTDGRLVYRPKRMWGDGSTDVVYEPQGFMLGEVGAAIRSA